MTEMSDEDPPFTFEWHYTPKGFFESPVSFDEEGIAFKAADGVATAVVPATQMSDVSEQRHLVHTVLERRFMARQLVSQRAFSLPEPSLCRRYKDGRQDAYAFAKGAVIRLSGGTADMVVVDADGNVVQNTKRDRIAREERLADMVTRHGANPVVAKLLDSRKAASRDSANELVHLAEIEEALSSYFGGERKAMDTLGLSKPDWHKLTKPANDPTNPTGRHRGKHLGEMRRPSRAELEEARRISALMIERFLEHLDAPSKA